MPHSKEEHEALHRALLAGDDVKLFTQGGCAIFATALHHEFKYPIHYVPGHGGHSISHVFCLLMSDGEFAVDALGTKHASDRVWDFAGDCAPPMSLAELQSRFCGLGEEGFLQEPWFVDPTTVRALARIQKYRAYFDGTKKELIPN
jgi:hypothetical protein